MGSAGSPASSPRSEDHKNSKKRAKPGGNGNSAPTFEELSMYFHLPAVKACAELGIGLMALKRTCRQFGLLRWPYRKPRSAAQGHASDSSTESEGYDEQPSQQPAMRSSDRPSDASNREMVRFAPQRDPCTLANVLSHTHRPQLQPASSPSRCAAHAAPANPASPPMLSPRHARGGAEAQLNTHSVHPRQQVQVGLRSAFAAPPLLQPPEPEQPHHHHRGATVPLLDPAAAPLLCSLLQQELGSRAAHPAHAWLRQQQQQQHYAHLPPHPPLPLPPQPPPPAPTLALAPTLSQLSQLLCAQPVLAPPAIDTAALWQVARQVVEVPGLAGELAAAIGAVLLEKQAHNSGR